MIIKKADFIEGATQTILSKFAPANWINKPFETVFSALGPIIIFRISWPLGILSFVGEHFGYGPGFLGKLVDNYIGAGKGKLDLSDENLKQASTSAIDDFMRKTTSSKATAQNDFLDNLKQIKGYLSNNDVLASYYILDNKLQKTARFSTILNNWKYYATGARYKAGFTGILYGILKGLAKGIAGAAIVGGVASMVSGIKPSETNKNTLPVENKPITQFDNTKQYYSNVANNVENTLIKFLDATISGFSSTFEKMYKRPLLGSQNMKEILNDVELLNKSDIFNINRWDAFLGPTVLNVAYKIMPLAKYEKIGKNEKVKDNSKLTKLLNEV